MKRHVFFAALLLCAAFAFSQDISLESVCSDLSKNGITKGDFLQSKTIAKTGKKLSSNGKFIFSTEGGYVRYDETERRAHYIDYLNGKFTRTPIVTGITELPDGTRYYSSGVMQAVEYEDAEGNTILDSLSLKRIL